MPKIGYACMICALGKVELALYSLYIEIFRGLKKTLMTGKKLAADSGLSCLPRSRPRQLL